MATLQNGGPGDPECRSFAYWAGSASVDAAVKGQPASRLLSLVALDCCFAVGVSQL